MATQGASDASGGSANLEQVRHLLTTVPASVLDRVVRDPNLGEEDVLRILSNPHARSEHLRTLARRPRFRSSYEIRKALARHRSAPSAVACNLLVHLYWKDLLECSTDVRVPPVVRRKAERILEARIEEMTVGERIALARRAGRALIASLRNDTDDGVLRALTGNPRLVEADAVFIAGSSSAPPGALRFLAEQSDWARRRAVRLALVCNRRTPVPVALRLVESLPAADLRAAARSEETPRVVRIGAERRLAAAAGRGRFG